MMRRINLTTAAAVNSLAALVWLSACNPAPKYVKPAAPSPVSYKEASPNEFKEGKGWIIAEPSDDKLRAKWWELFNDPQLNSLEERAVTANQSLRAAEANYRAARALVVSARAALYPTVSTAPAYTNTKISVTRGAQIITPGGGASSYSKAYNDFTLPIDVSYEPDFWHRVRNTVAADAYQAQASAADVATSQLSIQSQVAQDYFQIRALDMQLAVLEDTLKNYRDSLNLTSTLFKAGIDSDEDVSLAKTQLDTATAQATDLGVSRAQYEHAIAVLIGEPPANFALAPAPFVPQPPSVPVALPSTLLERRPDIAAAERQVAALNAEIGVARAAYYPNLALSASGGLDSASFTQWFTWPSRFWSLGPTLSQTIWEGGARRGQNEQAQANYDAGVANYRQTVLSAFQAVEDNLASLRILATEIDQQQTAIESSSHYLQLSLVRYKSGVDSYLNVITAQNAVLTNRETQVQAEAREMIASVSLIMALGGGWNRSDLPPVNHLTDKQRGWHPGGSALPATTNTIAAPNPPPVSASPLPTPTQNH